MWRAENRLTHEHGYILITTMIVLFVLTLLVLTGAESSTMNEKMQSNWQEYEAVFQRAQWGLQEMVLRFQGATMSLSVSSIDLQTQFTVIDVDACGNQTVDLESTANNGFSTVILNSRDIFARVPVLENCNAIPAHQVLWWKES